MGTARLNTEEQLTLEHVLGDMRLYHDEVQLRCFVLNQNGHGTIWGIYRQSLMELDSRRCSLAGRTRDHREAVAELDYARVRAGAWVWTAKGRRDRELARIEVTKYEESISNLDQQIVDVVRELRLILQVAENCKEQLGTINEERRQELSHEFWQAKFVKQSKLSLVGDGRLDAGMMDALMHLPAKEYKEAMSELQSVAPYDISTIMDNLRADAYMVDDDCKLELIESGTGLWMRPKLARGANAG